MFYEALNIYFPAFQSAVSIKDGCSSYVFPIHQRQGDMRPRTDRQLDMIEGERTSNRREKESNWKHCELKRQVERWNVADNTVAAEECRWTKMLPGTNNMVEEQLCTNSWSSSLSKNMLLRGGLLSFCRHCLKHKRILWLCNNEGEPRCLPEKHFAKNCEVNEVIHKNK